MWRGVRPSDDLGSETRKHNFTLHTQENITISSCSEECVSRVYIWTYFQMKQDITRTIIYGHNYTWYWGPLHIAASFSSSVCSSQSLCQQPSVLQPPLYDTPGQGMHLVREAAAQIYQGRHVLQSDIQCIYIMEHGLWCPAKMLQDIVCTKRWISYKTRVWCLQPFAGYHILVL